ncbi:MAG TPA: hypothetical protein VES19_14380 [Candidatus Limnocylindrales bacterium]|nr:hypothetical protein [Candidatus Limnocylindrales bacterium]
MSTTGNTSTAHAEGGGAMDGIRSIERAAPRSAGLAGIVFSVLFVASLLLLSERPPAGLDERAFVEWFEAHGLTVITVAALYLAPFAGIAFLWFVGVLRSRIGRGEDQFFATVFLGSGLLFVAMYWAAAAVLASLVAGNRYDAAPPLSATRLEDVRSVAFSYLFVMAARAAAVFMLVTCTIARRTGIFPRPLILVGYAIALAMLLSLSFLQWIVLLFPLWVSIASGFILVAERSAAGPADGGSRG